MDILHFLTLLFSSSTDCQSAASSQSDSSSRWQIRAAQPQDVIGVAQILADSFHSPEGILGWAYPFLRLGIYEDIRNRMHSTSPHYICLVAVDLAAEAATEVSDTTDKLAGTVEMAVRTTLPWDSDRYPDAKRGRSRYPYLSNLAVHPHHRRQGVAGQLLLSCERIAISWGFQDLYLHVLENNHQARQLYCKLGYRLHQVDSSWSAWFLRRPRQLLLYKHLSSASNP